MFGPLSLFEREIAVYKCTHVCVCTCTGTSKLCGCLHILRTLDVDISFFLTIFFDTSKYNETQSSMIYNETHRRKDTLPLTLE